MNNQMNFDPMTGQPLNNNVNNQNIQQNEVTNQNINNVPTIQTNNDVDIREQMQAIPTVDQNTQNFINNIQAKDEIKPDENKEKKNIILVIAIFIIIILAIVFLFPYLFNILG